MPDKYGHFTQDGSEFIVTTPLIPRPWINYLTNSRYCAVISQCAGGYSFYRDCRTDRILRWLPENWHFDRPGRYLYIKEPKAASRTPKTAKVWSATYQPLCIKPDSYQCRHGFGYTVIESRYFGISVQVTYFVPQRDDCEVWLVRIKNETKRKRSLEIYPYVEWLLGDYHNELRYRNIMNLYNRVWFDTQSRAIFAKKTAFWQDMGILPFKGNAFFASSLAVNDYWLRKDGFLGRYNTEQKPEAIMANKASQHQECSGEDGIAVFKHRLHLKANQAKEFTIVLGQLESKPKINSVIKKYRNLARAKSELENTKRIWRRRISDNLIISTPDKKLDLLVNSWLKYQIYICNFWSRSPSYYHEGSGGKGYRDSAQDSERILSLNPQISRQKILKLASLIRRDGTSAPGWSDTQGAHQFRPNKDHQIWLTSLVYAYIQETGDKQILNRRISYLRDKWIDGWHINHNFSSANRKTGGQGTLFEHLEANLNFTFNDVGNKGLPLIGHADWNDAIDAAGLRLRGQSVWLAQALVRSLNMLAELAKLTGKNKKNRDYLNKARIMTGRINRVAWDGNWYARGFTDSGSVYGSKSNPEGKIFLNPQAWALLSGVADAAKQKRIVNSVKKYLDGPHGLALFSPAYSRFNPQLGRISMFSEGTKENAAVFAHAATFMIVGLLMAGYGDLAYSTLVKILPNQQKDYDLYKTEPYAMAEYLVGSGHPYLYGEGAFTWVTGSAGWSFMAITEWLLGIRRDFTGLRIAPCIPSHWKRFSLRRKFRGATYDIEVSNPQGIQQGIREIYVDGRRIPGNLIKPHKDGKIHHVKVIMGITRKKR